MENKTRTKKILRGCIWAYTIILILFTLVCIFAGAGFLFLTIFGIPLYVGIPIYILMEILSIILIYSIETRRL